MLEDKTRSGQSALDEAVAAAADNAAKSLCTGDNLAELIADYYRHVADTDLLAATPTDLAGSLLSHYELARHRTPGTDNVRAFNPSLEEHGWHTGHTIVEVVTDDMPFLVDSVTAELSRMNRPIHIVVHPIFRVSRSEDGTLTGVEATTATDDSASKESWMHIEIDVETNNDDLSDIENNVRRVLRDVRASVEDWQAMRARAEEVAANVVAESPEDLRHESTEAQRLLTWLADNHFTFLGYREYDLIGDSGEEKLVPVKDSALGILRLRSQSDGSASFDRLSPTVRALSRERSVLILTKANSRATVHRPVYLDYVGVKKFDAQGNVIGERRFLGLLTSAAYTQSVMRIPVIDTKLKNVVERAGFGKGSHSHKDLHTLLETYPRDELMQMSENELYETAMSLLHLQERRQTRVFARRDRYGRFVSCLIFLPRDRYTTNMRLALTDVLHDEIAASDVDFSTRLTESVLARLHFVARAAKGHSIPEDFDTTALEQKLVDAARSWDDDMLDALRQDVGEEVAGRIVSGFDDLPEAYKEAYDPRNAVVDLRRFDAFTSGDVVAGTEPHHALEGRPVAGMVGNLYQPLGAPKQTRRFKIYRNEPLTLTSVLPVFRNLGVEVVDELPFELKRKDGSVAYMYDFGLRCPGEQLEGARERFTEAFAAAWSGASESDGLDRLVLFAKLTWRQVFMVRAYTKYLRQIGASYSQNYIEQVLLDNHEITHALVELFETRFDPATGASIEDRTAAGEAITKTIMAKLDDVASLDADRILRLYHTLITATLRTNFYQKDVQGLTKDYVSFKLSSRNIEELPEPRPAYEIWMYSPRVEGVHLRFGKVARGGLRWSDRPEDFRTEILGLVKAQIVKNAVIVPTGAKGGFFPKQLPDPSVDRDAWYAAGTEAYKTFISSLLDISDNYGARSEDGTREVIAPVDVVRHDDDDPYLVVAADKGTAAFSDTANGVAKSYGFWLGDAFASGGSVGYDHKAMGITARGAWESVKFHFREMGHDTQTQDFTCVAVGDMSGDVFGNGMLLSKHIRLVAAFNHMHIFIDPNPDSASSYVERERLFNEPRGTWDKYDTSTISEGGGVFSRSAKSIDITPQMREALGLDADVTKMTPTDLIKAILLAPVDLLWNGGIGTYVKAEEESHLDVGDRANDQIRLNGAELNVKVVGEGGNLGLTQLGRIEAAEHGVRLNTDAIDNSAGVDCSDHEVNIKILLDGIVADGDLTGKQRDDLLASMTDTVAELVLRDNIEQNVLLSNARYRSEWMLRTHRRYIKTLEAEGLLDRELEGLPDEKEFDRREAEDLGLTSPELSVLVAYSKIILQDDLIKSSITEDAWFKHILKDYFPQPLVERFLPRLAEHPLAREIIITALSNEMINRGGITFAYRNREETGANLEDVARAYVTSRTIFGLSEFTSAVEALDNKVSTSVQTEMYLEFRRLLDRSTRWFLNNRPGTLDVGAECDRYMPIVARHRKEMDTLLIGSELERMQGQLNSRVEAGVPAELARWEAGVLDAYSLLDILDLVETHKVPEDYATLLYFAVSEKFGFDRLLSEVASLPRETRWDSLARASARDDLYAAMESITSVVLETVDTSALDATLADRDQLNVIVDSWISQWMDANSDQLARVRRTFQDVLSLENVDLAALSVVLRQIRAVVKSTSV